MTTTTKGMNKTGTKIKCSNHIQQASHRAVPHCEFGHFAHLAVAGVEVEVDVAERHVDDLIVVY